MAEARFRRVEDHLITTPTGRLVWRRGHWARLPARGPKDSAALRDLFEVGVADLPPGSA